MEFIVEFEEGRVNKTVNSLVGLCLTLALPSMVMGSDPSDPLREGIGKQQLSQFEVVRAGFRGLSPGMTAEQTLSLLRIQKTQFVAACGRFTVFRIDQDSTLEIGVMEIGGKSVVSSAELRRGKKAVLHFPADD
jgi:hypothetical protein